MLFCESYFRKGVFIVRVSGNLNNDAIYIFKKEITSIIKYFEIKKAIFNLSDLNIDNDGLNIIINNCNIVKNNGGDVRFCGIDSNILKPSFHNEYEALSSFN